MAHREVSPAPRLKDVADAAGVHLSTVSRALNLKTSGSLSPAVVSRIRAAADALGYRGNAFAAGLRGGKSRTVGVVMRDLTNPMMPVMFRGIEDRLRETGYVALLSNTYAEPDRGVEVINQFLDRRVDGVIAVQAEIGDEGIAVVRRHGVPLLMLNGSSGEADVIRVLPDVAGGMRSAVDHLVELGHESIAHIGGPEGDPVSQTKVDAFFDTVRENGLQCPPDRIVRALRISKDAGREATRELLRAGTCPTAIIAADDILALGCLDELSRHRIACPRDVSIVGFNDMPYTSLIPPGLTTVRIPLEDMGRAAAEALLMLIEGAALAPAPRPLPTRLVVRGSSGNPPERVKQWALLDGEDPYGG